MSKRPRGPLTGWQPTTPRQKGILADLVARYKQHADEGTLKRGGRGMFYDLRPNGMGNGVTYRKPDSAHPIKARDGLPGFGPMEVHPAAVQEVLVLARRAGIIPEWWVADTRAPAGVGGGPYDDDPQDYAEGVVKRLDDAADYFDLDPQKFQPLYIEVLCEAEDLQPRLAQIADDYGVTVYSGAGFDGLKAKRDFAERALERDVPTVVLNVGDRDKHGEDAFVAAGEDAVAWASGAGAVLPVGVALKVLARIVELPQVRERPLLIFYRLALTTEQAERLGVLDADGKAEADAIPVQTLDGWLREAIEHLQDPTGRDRMYQEQDRARRRVEEGIRDLLRDRLEGGE
jgi:hypothetical protein